MRLAHFMGVTVQMHFCFNVSDPHLYTYTCVTSMCVLGQCKERTEQALAATAVPLEVSRECLTLRDGRRGYELVTDPAEEQLKKEVELVERVQQVLQQRIDKAFEQLWYGALA